MSKKIDILLIVIGGIIAIYVQAGESQNVYVLVAGIALLMFGLMRLSRRIPSKHDNDMTNDTIDE